MASLAVVLQAAMKLSDLERSQLVEALLPSVAPLGINFASLTREELDERWEAYQRSGSAGENWEEVRIRARQRAG